MFSWSAGSIKDKAGWKARTKFCVNYQLLTFLFLVLEKASQALLVKIYTKRISIAGAQTWRGLTGLNGPDRWF